MNHKLFTALVISALALLASCSEKGEVDEFDNWDARNEAYIDSIARTAALNADGKWMKLKAYTLGDSTSWYEGNNNYFVYVHKQKDGNGTYSPLFNDSVRVHYSGRLIPTASYPQGYNFDKSYSGTQLNELTDVPIINRTGGFIIGFTTALLNMKEGDRWTVYIPSYLAYKDADNAKIPKNSSLVFELQLAQIYRFGIDTDTSWH